MGFQLTWKPVVLPPADDEEAEQETTTLVTNFHQRVLQFGVPITRADWCLPSLIQRVP
jgi:hypothetical protein